MRDQFTDAPTCYYCGEPASDIEHVIPRALIAKVRRLSTDTDEMLEAWKALGWYTTRLKQVPSCRECNSMLGTHYFDTADERKTFVKKRLRQRYANLLRMPVWTPAELAELDGELQAFVVEALRKKLRLQRRLRF